MMKLYYNLSPNPMKVILLLEELGLKFDPVPVDTRKGEQFSEELKALNPNCKVPVLVDGETTVFDSNAMLLYLAEKHGRFLPADGDKARGELLSWLMFVASGLSPYSGQAVHFRVYAPEGQDYANRRYQFEAHRHYGILDERLKTRPYMLGDDYTIVDMGVWGWATRVPLIMGDDAWAEFPNLKRLCDEISARPAAVRAAALKEHHTFHPDFDADARKHMFRFLEKEKPAD